MKSWRTTALGVCMILGALAVAGRALLDGDPATTPSLEATGAALVGGWAMIMARDNSVTSAAAGAE